MREWNTRGIKSKRMVETYATRDYHTKRSKSERERQIPHAITFM